ncbi:inorganic phosphate transporter [Paenibacillus sp.]|uniref:inorganic phosphate transporter n=1 Tax=Paenibacillus sp. TaxID=58172 RepID=UPI002D378551|nr:inorganic phosphate transporter [Paenibacillus sp.]HZG87966.1 anion permease [Paenibacillus sp.]
MESLIIIAIVVVLALSFDFINGFHDTANAIATSVSTRALSPRTAILLAASLNFIGALTFTGVAKSIGGKVADPATLDHGMQIIIAALIAAIIWNLVTWWYGIPSSSSHALIGSMAGAVVSSAGFAGINASGFTSIIKGLILSPIIAFVVGFIVMKIIYFLFARANPRRVNRGFRSLQILTAAFQSFTHGTNDAQKAMGVITFALVAGGLQTDLEVPLWVKISAATAMGLGTSVGGWKIIKTMSSKIFKIEPANGFAADLTSSSVILTATVTGFPVSTTHVVTSGILGVGASKRFRDVKWDVAGKIVMTWFITIPISALIAGITFQIIKFLFL